VPRLGRTFRLDLPHEPEWYFYINLHGGGDSVELLPASPEDAKLFVWGEEGTERKRDAKLFVWGEEGTERVYFLCKVVSNKWLIVNPIHQFAGREEKGGDELMARQL